MIHAAWINVGIVVETRMARIAPPMTRAGFAELMDVPFDLARGWLNGTIEMPLKKMEDAEFYLGFSRGYLFGMLPLEEVERVRALHESRMAGWAYTPPVEAPRVSVAPARRFLIAHDGTVMLPPAEVFCSCGKHIR